MRRTGEEVNINEFLTSYLKHFKTNFHSQLNIIQSLSCPDPEQIIESSIPHKILKIKESLSALEQQTNLIPTYTKISAKTLQRFCLRINEYIEFRVAKTKGLIAQNAHNQLNAMCVAFHRVFVDINKKSRQQEVSQTDYQVSQVFNRICEVQSKYMVRIFKLLGAAEHTKQITNELIKIKSCSPKPISYENTPTEPNVNKDKNSIILNKFIQSPYYSSKIRPRKSLLQKIPHCTSNSTPLSIFHSNYGSRNSSSHINFNIQVNKNPQQTIQNKQRQRVNNATYCENVQNRTTTTNVQMSKTIGNGYYKWIDDVIEIGNDRSTKYTQEGLMKELVQSNKFNYTAILKYRKKAKKIKLKASEPPSKQQQSASTAIEWELKHKRSYTLDSSKSKPNTRKDEKFLGLPLLKRKSIKA